MHEKGQTAEASHELDTHGGGYCKSLRGGWFLLRRDHLRQHQELRCFRYRSTTRMARPYGFCLRWKSFLRSCVISARVPGQKIKTCRAAMRGTVVADSSAYSVRYCDSHLDIYSDSGECFLQPLGLLTHALCSLRVIHLSGTILDAARWFAEVHLLVYLLLPDKGHGSEGAQFRLIVHLRAGKRSSPDRVICCIRKADCKRGAPKTLSSGLQGTSAIR
jgi:hypothetical protein